MGNFFSSRQPQILVPKPYNDLHPLLSRLPSPPLPVESLFGVPDGILEAWDSTHDSSRALFQRYLNLPTEDRNEISEAVMSVFGDLNRIVDGIRQAERLFERERVEAADGYVAHIRSELDGLIGRVVELESAVIGLERRRDGAGWGEGEAEGEAEGNGAE